MLCHIAHVGALIINFDGIFDAYRLQHSREKADALAWDHAGRGKATGLGEAEWAVRGK